MRGWARALLMAMGLVFNSWSALAQRIDTPAITVRVHDYACLPIEFIERAQRHVTRIYGSIGVNTIWAEPVRPSERSAPSHDPTDLLIIILSRAMSRRLPIAEETLGLAAVTLLDGGKVAYILGDRVRRAAVQSATSPAFVLGMVMAHELGHLLLPRGSHSRIGLMRPIWQLVDFSRLDHQRWVFTPAQANGIRERANRPVTRASMGSENPRQ